MLSLRKTAIFSLILTISLVLTTAAYAETVEYDGLIEPYVVVDIGARMKESGMRWSIDGGQTVLTLRSIILSNRWEKFWAYFIKQHFSESKT